jgi:hypothetical protein
MALADVGSGCVMSRSSVLRVLVLLSTLSSASGCDGCRAERDAEAPDVDGALDDANEDVAAPQMMDTEVPPECDISPR